MCPISIVLTDSPYDSVTDTLAEKRVQKYGKSQKWCSLRMKKNCNAGSNAKCLKGTLKFGLIAAEEHKSVAHMKMQGRHAETAARLACQDAGKE